MRYRIIMLPFLGRYHVTITSWEPNGESMEKHTSFYDVGPEHCHTERPEEVLQWVAWAMS